MSARVNKSQINDTLFMKKSITSVVLFVGDMVGSAEISEQVFLTKVFDSGPG